MEENTKDTAKKGWTFLAKFAKFMVDVLGFGAAITGSLACMGIIDPKNIFTDYTKPPKA